MNIPDWIRKSKIIGHWHGGHGPLLLVIGAAHGNEYAGVKALELLFEMMDREPDINPSFQFFGGLLGVIGNLDAYKIGQRYIAKDLNRSWNKQHIEILKNTNPEKLEFEDKELREIVDILDIYMKKFIYNHVILLDLHSTSSASTVFTIASNEQQSIELAKSMNAPVVLGLTDLLPDTSLHYFNAQNFDASTVGLGFEAGHHDDPESIHRSIAAIINLMRSAKMIRPEDVSLRHDLILLNQKKITPSVLKVIYRHYIDDPKLWKMNGIYNNFQNISKGEMIATYDNQPIYSPHSGKILMPLYQAQGNDGFFIVEADENTFFDSVISK